MKVYVLNVEYAYGTLNGVECVGVYDTEEKAQKVMEGEIEEAEKKWTDRCDSFENAKNINATIGIRVATISSVGRYKHYLISEKEVQ